MIRQYFEKNTFKKLALWLLLIYLVRGFYLVFGPFDLFTEEAQYWVWSKQLALSYYSKPPLIAYINWLSTSLFGSTEFSIKFNALIFGYGFSLVLYLITHEIFKNRWLAVLATLLSLTLPFNHTVFNLFLTDTPLIFFWTLSLFFFWIAVHQDKMLGWLGLGVSCGLGFLAKYTMVFFAPFALLYLLIYQKQILLKPGIYATLIVALLVASPVFIWNFQMDFISFKHVESIGKSSLTAEKRLAFFSEYLGGQIAIVSPFLFFYLIPYFRFRQFQSKKLGFLLLGPLLAFGFFLIYSLTRRVEVNWPIFAYATLPILFADAYLQVSRKRLFFWLSGISFALCGLFFYFTPQLHQIGFSHLLPPKSDPAARVIGWEELGKTLNKHIDEVGDGSYFLFSESYHTASTASFYSRDQTRPYVINLGRRQNQFDLWEGIEQFEGTAAIGIYVTRQPNLPESVISGFDHLIRIDTVPARLGNEVVKRTIVATLVGFNHIQETSTDAY